MRQRPNIHIINVKVWAEADRIKVTRIQCWEQDNSKDDTWKLVICKANFVIVLTLRYNDSRTSIQVGPIIKITVH